MSSDRRHEIVNLNFGCLKAFSLPFHKITFYFHFATNFCHDLVTPSENIISEAYFLSYMSVLVSSHGLLFWRGIRYQDSLSKINEHWVVHIVYLCKKNVVTLYISVGKPLWVQTFYSFTQFQYIMFPQNTVKGTWISLAGHCTKNKKNNLVKMVKI